MSEPDIYKMGLHRRIIQSEGAGGWLITRVASGWIYSMRNPAIAVFVPFDNKFQEPTNEAGEK